MDIKESLKLKGNNLSNLTDDERSAYYELRCNEIGLAPASLPFEWLTTPKNVGGTWTQLYTLVPTKSVFQQLCKKHKVSIHITYVIEREDNIIIATAVASLPSGESAEQIGAVSMLEEVKIPGSGGRLMLAPEPKKSPTELANAIMKATTKACNRAVGWLLGLGIYEDTDAMNGNKAELSPNYKKMLNPATAATPVADEVLNDALAKINKLLTEGNFASIKKYREFIPDEVIKDARFKAFVNELYSKYRPQLENAGNVLPPHAENPDKGSESAINGDSKGNPDKGNPNESSSEKPDDKSEGTIILTNQNIVTDWKSVDKRLASNKQSDAYSEQELVDLISKFESESAAMPDKLRNSIKGSFDKLLNIPF